MKQQSKSLAIGAKDFLNNEYQNRIIYKCKQERNQLINRQVNNLIKKQLKLVSATKKIQKQLEGSQKQNIVFITPQSHIHKVERFRLQQSQKQWEKLKEFKIKNQQKIKKVENKLQQKQTLNLSRSSQNFQNFLKVQNRYRINLQKQFQRAEQLSQNLKNATPRKSPRINTSSSNIEQKLSRRAQNLKKLNQSKQKKFNEFVNRMKSFEEQRINKQLQDQIKKTQTPKKIPKFSVVQRSHEQQKLVATWSHKFEERFQKFQKHRIDMQQQKQKQIFDRSMERILSKQQVFFRKHENQQKIAEKRIQLVQQKIKKINTIRGSLSTNKSLINFNHNIKKISQDFQKQEHNVVMRKIYYILQKLKKLPSSEKLKKFQINLLLQNLDPNCNQYKQVCRYLQQGKEKFFQQKRKD